MAVRPALVEPTPVVNTARGIILATYLRIKDFPVPESDELPGNVEMPSFYSYRDHPPSTNAVDFVHEYHAFHRNTKQNTVRTGIVVQWFTYGDSTGQDNGDR